jgi:hypothetical protein
VFADQGPVAESLETDVDAVGHGLLVWVLGDEVLLEEAERGGRGRCCQADSVSIEVLQQLPPQTVDGSVTLVGDNEMEGIEGDGRVIRYRPKLAIVVAPGLESRTLLGWLV